MSQFFAGAITVAFIWLSYFSLHYHQPAKMVSIWRDKKSATIADIYGITPDEVNKPIRLFGN